MSATAGANDILEVDEVVVTRGDFTLGPLSFDVPAGRTTALIGMNGSGKTTTIGCVLGLVAHTGEVRVLGQTVGPADRTHLRHLGHVADTDETLLDELTAEEYWALVASIRDSGRRDLSLAHAERLAARLSFAPGRRLIGSFSHGMKKKTQLVAALMHDPALVVVDELSNGLDPLSFSVAAQLLAEAAAAGAAVLASSHDMGWVRRHSDRVLVLHRGLVSRSGSPDELEADDTFEGILASPGRDTQQ